MIYDLAIIGGGPAAVAAGVYASRKKLKTVFVTKDFQSQSAVSSDIQNWIGTISITGQDFAKNLEGHLRAYASDTLDIITGEEIVSVERKDFGFTVVSKNNSYDANTLLIATGSKRKKLNVPGADLFENKGITYCASCDGPLFGGQDVAIIGGGNSVFESAAQLLAYAKSVTLLSRSELLKADPETVEKIVADPKFTLIKNVNIREIKGDKFVSSLIYEKKNTGGRHEIFVSGVFVEIGSVPATEFVKDLVDIDDWGQVMVDPKTQRTSLPGVWAADDCTDGLYHQNNIAAGDAVKALEDIYVKLRAS